MRRPLLTPSQRAILLSLCSAMYGLAIAITSYPHWIRASTPDQLPGFMKSIGLDAHSSFRVFGAIVAFPLIAAIAVRPIVRLLSRPDTRAWARNGAAFAMLIALWYATVSNSIPWTLIPAAIAIAVFVLLRRMDMRFSRRDVLLIASFLPVFMALTDATHLSVEQCVVIAAASVIALRLAIEMMWRTGTPACPPDRRERLSSSLCFTVSPVALMLESHLLSRDQRHAGWPALLVVFVTPILMRAFVGNSSLTRRRLRIAIAFAIYPLAVWGYISASGLLAAEGMPRASFFEEMQHLTPANAMLHGAKPYVDVVPPHGLIQDALLDYVILRTGPKTLGHVLRVRLMLNSVMSVLFYAVAAEATGSADLGFLAFSASAIMGQGGGFLRFAPGMFCLVVCVAALRRRKPRWMFAAGALIIMAGLTSVDFGVYTIAITLFSALRFQNAKWRALGAATIGAAITAAIASLWMMIGGYFVAFLRVTLFEVGRVGPAYVLTPFDAPKPLDRRFPSLLAGIFDGVSLSYLVWFACLLTIAVVLANGLRARGRRHAAIDAPLAIAFFIVILGIAYAERHHIYFQTLVVPLIVITAYRLSRARSTTARLGAPALAMLLFITIDFTAHFAIVGWLRRAHGPIDADWHEVGLPRARGALLRQPDIATLDSITRYVTTHLGPNETFFDFTNRGLVYFLLDRELPVRQVEVAYYEPEELQREVIARIERNPRIRAAMVPLPNLDPSGVDLIGNDVRAPLVWRYLQEHFEPDFEEGSVVFWRRKEGQTPSSAQPRGKARLDAARGRTGASAPPALLASSR
jgi:hypothetical protein